MQDAEGEWDRGECEMHLVALSVDRERWTTTAGMDGQSISFADEDRESGEVWTHAPGGNGFRKPLAEYGPPEPALPNSTDPVGNSDMEESTIGRQERVQGTSVSARRLTISAFHNDRLNGKRVRNLECLEHAFQGLHEGSSTSPPASPIGPVVLVFDGDVDVDHVLPGDVVDVELHPAAPLARVVDEVGLDLCLEVLNHIQRGVVRDLQVGHLPHRTRSSDVVDELGRGEERVGGDDLLSVHSPEDCGHQSKLFDEQPVVVDEDHVANVVRICEEEVSGNMVSKRTQSSEEPRSRDSRVAKMKIRLSNSVLRRQSEGSEHSYSRGGTIRALTLHCLQR
jgi:hypothetical protein